MKKNIYIHTKNIIIIFLGAFIFAFGINYFAIPNQLAEGGFTGITLLLYYLFKWSPGIVLFILNIPLLFVGYKVFGKRTFIYTIIGIAAVSLMLEVTKGWGGPQNDRLLAALYTGVLVGIGLGLIFRVGGTTGGVDIIARLVNKYFDWSIGRTMFLFDLGIILSSVFIITVNKAMYTLVAVFISARVVDFVVEGINASKAATIISGAANELAKTITEKMDRGVTLLKGKGGYTGQEREILYVVLAPNEMPKLKHIVNQLDPHAFVVVHDARDVLGAGFSYEKVYENRVIKNKG
ncbi:YitT family protein [Paenactinomyces guangxiensis]|uniref:YitT family protein n=1 Tax=Paenactinomyces guangxiensis TaxID=1490290 RepID=A0A7W1WR22_9BACL|nr:YitT family protein [Paenactinomyces guangxiensis]MBA4494481.1 YitT family protein [Paenactinomyces guangxiensis]MBH8591464.1 YitT family protein [Paenactinomyces guangxiensis]